MLGGDESFHYAECQDCGCLQIVKFPEDMTRYYPAGYYSFGNFKKSGFKFWLKNFRLKQLMVSDILPLWLLKKITRNYPLFWIYKKLGITRQSAVLDVGAGSGEHVYQLRSAGIEHAIGIDAFINEDLTVDGKILVIKGELNSDLGPFDLLTFHHSYEHMQKQIETLDIARRILKPNGKILIRIPSVSSWAYQEYKENWFQLDAPRHFYLHSHRSIQLLAEQAKLKVTQFWCDSNELQFLISAQYKDKIFGNHPNSYLQNRRIFKQNPKLRREMVAKSTKANEMLQGDQICIVLEREQDIF